jgi:hypothetical protein
MWVIPFESEVVHLLTILIQLCFLQSKSHHGELPWNADSTELTKSKYF